MNDTHDSCWTLVNPIIQKTLVHNFLYLQPFTTQVVGWVGLIKFEVCFPRIFMILLDPSTGLQVRNRKAGARSRASSVGPVAFSPLISVVHSRFGTWIFSFGIGVFTGILVIIYWIFQLD